MLSVPKINEGLPHTTCCAALVSTCAATLTLKLWLVTRININWDEFHFLAQIHEGWRGELTSSFLTQFTHVFRWLPSIGMDEIDQITTGRVVMVLLLALTAWLIWKVAARWFRPMPALLAPLAFLASWPVLKHGGSFRYDTMIALVVMGILFVLVSGRSPALRYAWAGLLGGIGAAISVKIALFAPLIGLLVLLDTAARSDSPKARLWYLLRNGSALILVAALAAAILFIAHHWTISGDFRFGEMALASAAAEKTVFESGFMPQYWHWAGIYDHDRPIWLFMFAGLLVAALLRRWQIAATALALTPILYYRNAFPYFYVPMLAPASLLVPMAIAPVTWLLRRRQVKGAEVISVLGVALILIVTALGKIWTLSWEFQSQQRAVVRAVHAIFPNPVPYVDHCGMIASFRKVGPFLSTWGVEVYRAQGQSLMQEAVAAAKPPMVLVDSSVLDPGSPRFQELLPEDRRIIVTQYVPYWGPIRVAGVNVELRPGTSVTVDLPFPGDYRLDASHPVLVGGDLHRPGSTVRLLETQIRIETPREATGPMNETVRLVWAAARPPPAEVPPIQPLFSPL